MHYYGYYQIASGLSIPSRVSSRIRQDLLNATRCLVLSKFSCARPAAEAELNSPALSLYIRFTFQGSIAGCLLAPEYMPPNCQLWHGSINPEDAFFQSNHPKDISPETKQARKEEREGGTDVRGKLKTG